MHKIKNVFFGLQFNDETLLHLQTKMSFNTLVTGNQGDTEFYGRLAGSLLYSIYGSPPALTRSLMARCLVSWVLWLMSSWLTAWLNLTWLISLVRLFSLWIVYYAVYCTASCVVWLVSVPRTRYFASSLGNKRKIVNQLEVFSMLVSHSKLIFFSKLRQSLGSYSPSWWKLSMYTYKCIVWHILAW